MAASPTAVSKFLSSNAQDFIEDGEHVIRAYAVDKIPEQ